MNLTLIELKLSLTWKLLKGEIIPWSRTTNNCNPSYYRVMGLIMNLINRTHNIFTCFEGFDPRKKTFFLGSEFMWWDLPFMWEGDYVFIYSANWIITPSQGMFWSQKWILLILSIDNCFYKLYLRYQWKLLY